MRNEGSLATEEHFAGQPGPDFESVEIFFGRNNGDERAVRCRHRGHIPIVAVRPSTTY